MNEKVDKIISSNTMYLPIPEYVLILQLAGRSVGGLDQTSPSTQEAKFSLFLFFIYFTTLFFNTFLLFWLIRLLSNIG